MARFFGGHTTSASARASPSKRKYLTDAAKFQPLTARRFIGNCSWLTTCLLGIDSVLAQGFLLLAVIGLFAACIVGCLSSRVVVWCIVGLVCLLLLAFAWGISHEVWLFMNARVILQGHQMLYSGTVSEERRVELQQTFKGWSRLSCMDADHHVFQKWQRVCNNDPGWRVARRPFLVIADFEPDTQGRFRYYVVDNEALYNQRDMKGWRYFRCCILCPRNVNDDVTAALDAWERLRAEIVRLPTARDLAKKLNGFTLKFVQADNSVDSIALYAQPPPPKRKNARALQPLPVEELCASFEPLLAEARSEAEKLREKQADRRKQEPAEKEQEIAECVCCWTSPASFVMDECGHLVFCDTCRRRSIAQHVNRVSPAELTNREMQCTTISCPLCRARSCLVPRDAFEGRLYIL